MIIGQILVTIMLTIIIMVLLRITIDLFKDGVFLEILLGLIYLICAISVILIAINVWINAYY